MKEKEPIKYRDFLVCWDEYCCIGWKTEPELRELIENKKVNWFKYKDALEPTRVNYEPPERDR